MRNARLLIALGVVVALSATAEATSLYWYAPSSIATGSSAGGTSQQLVSDSGLVWGLAVDSVHNWMYWTYADNSGSSGGVRRAHLDGTGTQSILTDANRPGGIVVDPAGGKIYFDDYDSQGTNGTIKSANLDGSAITLVHGGLNEPWGLAFDPINNRIYWSNLNVFVSNASIGGCNVDGTNVRTIISTGLSNPRGLAIDPATQTLFWSDNVQHKIEKAAVDGTGRSTVLAYNTSDGIVFDPTTSSISWTDFATPGKILRAGVDGSGMTTLFSGMGNPRNITVAVPEPASAGLIVAGAIAVIRRRSKRVQLLS